MTFEGDCFSNSRAAAFRLAWCCVKSYIHTQAILLLQPVNASFAFGVIKNAEFVMGNLFYLKADGEMAEWLKAMVC